MAKTKKHAAKVKGTSSSGRGQKGEKKAGRAEARAANPDEAALLALLEVIEATAKAGASSPRYDVFDAATAAARLAEQAEPWRASFERADALVPGTSDALDRLATAARAIRFIRAKLVQAQSVEDDVVVPAELVDTADALRRAMITVLDYNLGEKVEMAASLAFIRQGQGHQDRVNDLHALATHYEENATALAKDGARYDAKDARRARECAALIQERIVAERKTASARWTELQAGANTLMLDAYERVRRTLIFLDVTASIDEYPTIFAAVRALSGRTPKRSAAADAPSNGAPAPDATPPA